MKFWIIFIGIIILTFDLNGQEIPPSSIISYGKDRNMLIAQTKRDFIYNDKNYVTSESYYANQFMSLVPKWILTFKRETKYNQDGSEYLNRYFNYYSYEEGDTRPRLSSLSENFSEWSADRSEFMNMFVYRYFDREGVENGFNANRSFNYYDQNECFTSSETYTSGDSELNEASWTEGTTTIRETDASCRTIGQESYTGGALIGTITTKYDQQNRLIREERLSGLQDSSRLSRELYAYEYDDFNRLLRERTEYRENGGFNFYTQEMIYIYSDLEFPDTVFIYFETPYTTFRGFEVYEYDSKGRDVYTETYEYYGENLDSIRFTGKTTVEFNVNDQISKVTGYWCADDVSCRNIVTTRKYAEGQTLLGWTSIRTEYRHDFPVDETISTFEIQYRCDGSKAEEIATTNGEVTSRVEYIYPILPSCTTISAEENTVVVPNPASDLITIWSTYLNGLDTQIRIVDMAGRIFKEDRTDARIQTSYDVNDVPTGLYFSNCIESRVAYLSR